MHMVVLFYYSEISFENSEKSFSLIQLSFSKKSEQTSQNLVTINRLGANNCTQSEINQVHMLNWECV